jgi:hypothetical protein
LPDLAAAQCSRLLLVNAQCARGSLGAQAFGLVLERQASGPRAASGFARFSDLSTAQAWACFCSFSASPHRQPVRSIHPLAANRRHRDRAGVAPSFRFSASVAVTSGSNHAGL